MNVYVIDSIAEIQAAVFIFEVATFICEISAEFTVQLYNV